MNSLRMTKNEKRLNYNDLQAFKDVDPSMYAMIPGWTPQIGALKVPKNELDQINSTEESQEQIKKKNPHFSPNIFSAKTSIFLKKIVSMQNK